MNRAGGWLALALLFWMPSALCAQEAESNEEHEVLFRQAVEALRLNQFEVASTAFEASLRIAPQAKTACNLALTYDRWGGHDVRARDAYVRCAELDRGGRFRDHALSRAAALREVIASRPPEPERPDPIIVVPDPVDDYQPRPAQPQVVAPPTRGLLWAGVAFTVAGVAAVGSGAVPSVSASADSDTILLKYPNRRIAPDDDAYLRLNDDFNRKRNVALGLFVAGGAVVLVGAAFIIADVVRQGNRPPAALVGVAPTDGGAMAVGRFEF